MATDRPGLQPGNQPSNQQRRTRAALLAAAGRLLRAGLRPTVAQVADEALVSRRTAYRYFPSADQLLADAALELTTGDISARITAKGPVERVDQVVTTLNASTADQEWALRTMIRTSLEGPLDPRSPRGERRMAWIEEALDPARNQLPPRVFRRVAAAIALAVGIEARLSLIEVAGLSDAEADRVSRWVASLAVRSALDDPASVGRLPRRRP